MRTFATFLLLFLLAALISGLLTYPAWVLVQGFSDVAIHRVMHRVGMLVLAVATVIFLRRLGLANKAVMGYDMPRAEFIKQMSLGLLAGIALMLPLSAAMFGLQLLSLDDAAYSSMQAAPLTKLIAQGILSGFVVAFIEETFCRGVLFSTIKRESGLWLAVLLPSLLYAATHFMDGVLRIPTEEVTYMSGLQVVAGMFTRFSNPAEIADAFIALTTLGILLALVRQRTGAIAGSVGLHAGGIAVITVVGEHSVPNIHTPLNWLIGSYNHGMIGWFAFAWFAAIALVYWRMTIPNARAVQQRSTAN